MFDFADPSGPEYGRVALDGRHRSTNPYWEEDSHCKSGCRYEITAPACEAVTSVPHNCRDQQPFPTLWLLDPSPEANQDNLGRDPSLSHCIAVRNPSQHSRERRLFKEKPLAHAPRCRLFLRGQ